MQQMRGDGFFSTINFRDLEEKKIKAPKIPEIKDMLDTSNFDQYDDDDGEEWMAHNTKDSDKLFEEF